MEQPNNSAKALDTAIKANFGALADLLTCAAKTAGEARDHAHAAQRNTAIGAIMDLDRLLADAIALHSAAIALHRRAPL